jgi:undecaprenyl-diphosphatase
MDWLLLLKALILGIVEGLTEFLPISSTGHLILTASLLGMNDAKGKMFEIFIQSGAMLAIVWEYRARFLGLFKAAVGDEAAQRFLINLVIAALPAGLLGLLLGDYIKAHLFNAVPVALAFIIGGFIILWVEKRTPAVRVQEVDDMRWSDALKVGLAQAFALIPGTSRSGATIIGGMLFGLSRKAATEFSFFLAVPTLMAAGAYDLFRHRHLLSVEDVAPFTVGLIAAFVSAFICVRWLIRYIANHDFKIFAWYRIAFGAAVLITAYAGWVDWAPLPD